MPPKKSYRPKRPGGRRWGRLVDQAVRRDFGKCHICGHYGAKTGDHVIPVSEDEELFWKLSNVKAAHGYPHGCTDCTYAAVQLGEDPRPVYCNEIRQDDSIEKGRARIEKRTGLKLCKDETPEGRDWGQM